MNDHTTAMAAEQDDEISLLDLLQTVAENIKLLVFAHDNHRAIGFYRKHGYNITQEFNQDKHRKMFLMIKKIN